jgi:CHAD domain-containing protein
MAKRKIKWDERRGVAVNASRVLPVLVAGFFDEVRSFLAERAAGAAADQDREPEQLHRMRLAAKRLRYTLELFRRCYGPALEKRLDALKKLQDSLGDVNDVVATRRLLGNSVDGSVQEFLDGRALEKAAEFHTHWKEVFDAPGQEKWWTEYLERNAHAPARPKPV